MQYNRQMPSLKSHSSYRILAAELTAAVSDKSSYEFSSLQKILESHGWTFEEYFEAYEIELVAKKLKGEQ